LRGWCEQTIRVCVGLLASHCARACFDKHELETDAQAKADYLEKGKNLIESALILPGGTENPGVYKWRAIFIAEASRSKSPKERIALVSNGATGVSSDDQVN
jgi:hypothetical protein